MSFLGSMITAALGWQSANMSNKQFEKNFEFQKENWAYMKEQNELTRQREDDAVQRRVADMKAAGINPVLAAGSAAEAGSHVATTAPQGQAPIGRGLAAVDAALSMMRQKSDISRTQAETDLVKQKVATEVQNRDIALKDYQLRVGDQEINWARVLNDTRGLDQNATRIAIDLSRLGYEGERLRHEAKRLEHDRERINLEAKRVFNDTERVQLQKNRDLVLNELDKARKGLVNEERVSEQLRQLGLGWDVEHKVVEHEALVWDFLMSQAAGYRTKDNLVWADRVNPLRSFSSPYNLNKARAANESVGFILSDKLRYMRRTLGL